MIIKFIHKIMAKKKAKKKEVELFYANRDKYERALKLVELKKFKTVREAYESIGGLLREGNGYKQV